MQGGPTVSPSIQWSTSEYGAPIPRSREGNRFPSFQRSEGGTPTPREDGSAVSATPHPHRTRIESVHIRGFRSLADVELDGLGQTVDLIGANGSGKSNLIRFFEMLSRMLRARRLAEYIEEYIERQGGCGRSALRWPRGDANHPGRASTADRPGPKRLSDSRSLTRTRTVSSLPRRPFDSVGKDSRRPHRGSTWVTVTVRPQSWRRHRHPTPTPSTR